MQRIDYDEGGERKERCFKDKYIAIVLCGVAVALGLAVGLGVGLSGRTQVCDEGTATATATAPASPGPGSTQQPPATDYCPLHAEPDGPWSNFRLPDYIDPKHYQLELEPDLEGGVYTGTVVVHIHTTRPTKYIWLHTKEGRLTAPPALSRRGGGSLASPTPLALRRCFEYREHQYLVVEAEEELPATPAGHEYLLTLHFHSSLLGSLVGFYKTTYVENGIVKNIAATDHEPTDARKTFPCFDEPNKKATYTITLIHRTPYKVLSNMPVEKEELDGDLRKTTFQKSVPMSTYLVCFAVHQFTYIEKISSRGIPLRIYVQPNQRHTAEFAANTTKLIFDYFETYFNFNYSLPKLDMIAIPDFGTGAMENWGLVTYRETNLLFDEKESSSNNQQRVATVIAHELVHQWFGNLVTMDWWDDLWLNEGFASYFEYIGVNSAMPDWLMLDQILADDVLSVMADDALLSSHPIIVNVSTPAEITSVFDGISYSKGASILRMLRNWITPEHFQKGCQKYLSDHRYQNAKTDDFWEALAQVSGKPVKEVMDTWTRQMGFPVLSLGSNAKLTQKRFLLDVNANPTEPPSYLNYRWNIPIQWHSLDGQNGTLLFNMSKEAETIHPSPNDTIKVNTDHVGFFRVQYEEAAWRRIINELQNNHTQFSQADRTGFIDDTFSLARATLLKYSVALNMTQYLSKEEDYLPWSKAISSIAYIRDMLEDNHTLYTKFQMYWRKQVKPIASALGWDDSSTHLNRLLREDVLGLACRMEDPEALRNATSLFQEWLAGNRIAPNLRLIVYRYGMQWAGNQTLWEYMFKMYQNTPLAQEKDKLLYGLASVNDVQLLDRFLNYLKNESLIKSQDVFTIIRYISYNKFGKTMAWDWTRLNWEYLVQRYTITSRNLGRLILRITRSFNTELSLWQMKDFFAKYPEAGAGEIPRRQALETVQTNIDWLKNNKNEIDQWLQSNS